MNAIKLLASGMLVCLPAVAAAQGGWYAGLDVGAARSEVEIDEHLFSDDTTDEASGSTTGFRLRGGYRFGRFFAIELAYADFGQFENHFDPDDCPIGAPGPCPVDVRTSISGFIGSVVGTLPLGEHWFMNARAGFGSIKVHTRALGATSVDDSSDNGSFNYGIGGGYRFDDHWEILLDYSAFDQLDLGLTLSGSFGIYDLGETTMTSLGVNYRW